MRKIKPLRKGSFASRVMRALGMHRGSELPFTLQEEKRHPDVSTSYNNIILRNAKLEAKRLKAKALMEHEKRTHLPR
ncbi:hypothetical protein KAU55_01200 [Candidatus Bathyarchaeota archaeon]|nr:hypothetical protein [Candidatus Bathyarchaeota archaeon]MCK4668967.1 hypothetical protein [Candidatus Bathyarchaeota archaeon]